MAIEERKVPAWMKLPATLQHQFFQHAEEEAGKSKVKLLERSARLKSFEEYFKPKKIPEDDDWKSWRVAVVDGSSSPSTSERLGGRYGAYTAGYMIFEGVERVEEDYVSGSLVADQMGDPEVSRRVISMLRTMKERQLALKCLEEKDADYVLIDGSFFGFRVDAYMIKDEGIDVEGFKVGRELTEFVSDMSRKLLASSKTIGIIKRSRSNALDGWIAWKFKDMGRCVGMNDKHFLSHFLQPRYWFAYESLFGNSGNFHIFAHFLKAYERYAVKKGVKDMNLVFEKAKDEANIQHIHPKDPMLIFDAARYFARCSPTASPFELETSRMLKIEPLLSYFQAFHNPVTGLPFPLDLIDESVGVPEGFVKEFVEEIEARLIKDHELKDKSLLQGFFSYLNPQKEED